MSETPKKVNLDAALREWPDVEKSPVELDESAQAVVTRIQAGERGKTAATLSDENLFAAPLGQSAEDGHNSAALAVEQREVPKMTMADRERDRRSLQDLAKMAADLQGPVSGPMSGLTPPPPSARASAPSGIQPAASSAPGAAKGEDSGLIDLRAVNSEPAPSVAPAPTSSAKAHGLASQGLFDEEPASMKQPAPSLPPMPASMPPASMPPQSMPQAYSQAPAPANHASMAPQAHASIAPAHASSSQPALQQKKGNGAVIALVFGGVVALSAAAAGTFFYLKMKKPAEAPVAAATQPAPDVKPAPTQAAAPVETAPTPAAEPSMDPNALPTATPEKVAVAPKGGAKPAAKPAFPADAPAKPEPPKAEAKLTQKDLPPAASGPAGNLGAAMAGAVGDDGKPKQEMKPAADDKSAPAGSVPQKPSQGAVTGAIGAVLPSARVCLGPDDPVSHASIVFGSDGKVQSVTVTGAAQGKMAEGCIKDALMKAKVGPFAEPSYSTRITIRHQ